LEMNNVGTVGMTNLYLVSQTPGLVSFGRKKNEEGSASLYDFPLVEDSGPNFRYHREDGTIEQVRLDVLQIPLSDSELKPGSIVKLPLWVRCPELIGSSDYNLFLYYDTVCNPSKATPRLKCLTVNLTGQPSLSLSCRRRGLLRHSNSPGQQIMASLSNMSRDLASSMDTLTVTQLVLISREQRLGLLQSSGTCCAVSRGETTNLALQTEVVDTVDSQWKDMARLKQLPANVVIPGGNLYFSSVISSGIASQPAHCPPFIDFIKGYMTHNLGRRGNPPLLDQDMCVVMWRSSGSSSTMGQIMVAIDDVDEGAEDLLVVNGVSEEVELIEPAPSYPVIVDVKVDSEATNDFVKFHHYCVKAIIVMTSRGSKGVLVEYRLDQQIRGARVSGNTDGIVWLSEGDQIKLDLCVTVSRPDFFHLKNFQIRAKSQDICDKTYFETSNDDFLPLDIGFTVRQE